MTNATTRAIPRISNMATPSALTFVNQQWRRSGVPRAAAP
jgi:hypothetical protein